MITVVSSKKILQLLDVQLGKNKIYTVFNLQKWAKKFFNEIF